MCTAVPDESVSQRKWHWSVPLLYFKIAVLEVTHWLSHTSWGCRSYSPQSPPSQALMLPCLLSSWLSASVALTLIALSLPGSDLSQSLSGDKSHHSFQSVFGPGISCCCSPQGAPCCCSPATLRPAFLLASLGAVCFTSPALLRTLKGSTLPQALRSPTSSRMPD